MTASFDSGVGGFTGRERLKLVQDGNQIDVSLTQLARAMVAAQAGSAPPLEAAGAGPLSVSARRILANAMRGISPIDTVASGVTLTIGTAGAASTINGATVAKGAQMFNPDSPLIERPLGNFTETGTGWITAGNQANPGIRFVTDSKNTDLCIQTDDVFDPINFKYGMMGYVTNLRTGVRGRVQASDFVVNNSYAYAYVKLAFPNNDPRVIEWYMGSGCTMRGVNVDAGYTIWRRPSAGEPKAAVIWDSFGQQAIDSGPGATTATNRIRMATIDYFGEGLGIPVLFNASRGQCGYAAGGPTQNHLGRINQGLLDISYIGAQDLILISGSVNDNNADFDATLQSLVTQTVSALMAKQPGAIIVGTGPQRTWDGAAGFNTPQSRYDMVRNGFAAAAGSDPRMIYIDNSAQGEGWYANDAHNATVFGNNGGATPLHPNDIGKVYLGRSRLAMSVLSAVGARLSSRFGG